MSARRGRVGVVGSNLVVSEPQRARQAGILGVCTCTDPDGLRVELIEYAPGVLGSRIDDLESRT